MTSEPRVHARDASVVEAAELLKLMANPNRLAILCRLSEGEASVGEMEAALGIRQPTLSQQLGELRKAELVDFRREAKIVFYRLSDARARSIVGHVHDLFCGPRPAQAAPGTRLAMAAAVPHSAAHTHAAVFGRILDADEPEKLSV